MHEVRGPPYRNSALILLLAINFFLLNLFKWGRGVGAEGGPELCGGVQVSMAMFL